MKKTRAIAPGLLLAILVAMFSFLAQEWPLMGRLGLSALSLAIMTGMVLGNTVYPRVASLCGAGIGFSKQTVLRLGIIMFGFKLTLHDIALVGWAGVLIDVATLSSTFLLAYWIGRRWLGLDDQSVILIGAGSSICGAAAVLATEPVIKAHADKVAVAVATVVVFGTLAMFLWPAGYGLLHGYGLSEHRFGVFVGSTIHEVAQAAVAGRAVGAEAMNAAVITKMIRVLLLAPFLMLLSIWRSGRADRGVQGRGDTRITIPWFAILFLLVAVLNSFAHLPPVVRHTLIGLDNLLLAVAMAALGMTTQMRSVRKAGVRPLLLALVLFLWLLFGCTLINAGMNLIFSV